MSRTRRPVMERVAHAAERLERHTLAVGLALLAVAAFFAYLSVIAINGVPLSNPYKLRAEVPPDAPLLKDGDEVRIAGQRAGQVRKVEVGSSGGALISMDINAEPVGRDARAIVRLRGLAGSTYVEIVPGDRGHPLPSGGLVPRARTSAGVELTDVVATFDPTTTQALRATLAGFGLGFAGRGSDVNAALGDLPPTLRDAPAILRAASPRPGDLAALLANIRHTARGFATPGGRDLRGLLPAASAAFGTLAARGPQVQGTIERLRPLNATARATLPVADRLLGDATPALRALAPATRALARALPSLEALLERRRDLPALTRLSRRAVPVLTTAAPLLRELAPAAGSLAPLAEPLGPFSTYLAPYGRELFLGPDGFTRWGKFRYDVGQAPGARAVRFAPVFTCGRARDPYPAPGAALTQEEPCRG